MIASLSGVRGILNDDMSLDRLAGFCGNFAQLVRAPEVLLARDPRSTGPAIARCAAGALMAQGARVVDCGIISTPALFRESRLSGRPGVMVTASHNEPQFNGLKFIVEGRGIGSDAFDLVVKEEHGKGRGFGPGSVRKLQRTAYVDDLAGRFGEGTCEGVRVAVDLGGGAAISHSFELLRRLGCEVVSINDAYGVFNRKVDPVADDLVLLRKLVKERGCDVGLGFDCDGDRLVIVDPEGRKRTGDYMLTLALSEILGEALEKTVVVSLDTTQAVDEVVQKAGGRTFRS
jgi:phosphomannomutase/phosphoglucomutase